MLLAFCFAVLLVPAPAGAQTYIRRYLGGRRTLWIDCIAAAFAGVAGYSATVPLG